ncbi:MAG: hypothetical protein RL103_1606, partial [Pseudomonadota bacterium]
FTQTGNFFLLESLNQIHFEFFQSSIMHNATLKAASMMQALNLEGEIKHNSRGGQRIDSLRLYICFMDG